MVKRLHYGRHSRRSADTVNLSKCKMCGTTNPTLPGEPLAEKCTGCGAQIPKSNSAVLPSDFRRIPRARRIGMGRD